MAPFAAGSRVVVLPLGRKPGVVIDVGRGGHYRVRVEHTTVSCREGDLAAAAEPGKKKRARGDATDRRTPEPDAAAPGSVDLHALTVEEALARVVEAIDAALRRGADRLEVIHGKGSGRVRDAVHHYLKTMTVVASFRLDPANPGVTWIYF